MAATTSVPRWNNVTMHINRPGLGVSGYLVYAAAAGLVSLERTCAHCRASGVKNAIWDGDYYCRDCYRCAAVLARRGE